MERHSLLDSLEVRYGPLWTCESVKRFKISLNTQNKSAYGFENFFQQGLARNLENV